MVGASGQAYSLEAVVVLLLGGVVLLTDACRSPIVEITVSPEADKKHIRILDLAWDVGGNWRQGDWVGLYNQPPSPQVAPVFRSDVKQGLGDVRTGIQEGRKFEEPNFAKRCLGWWAAYWHANNPNPVAVSCLSTNPRWMDENRNVIGNLPLNNMFIPGTHDSGAFNLNYRPFSDNRVNKYIYTQDETIMEQLINGARILDLRLAIHEGKFWINHGIARLHPLEHVLNDVKTFVDRTNEIVVLDFHEFPAGFKKSSDHHELINYVRSVLGPRLAPPHLGWGVTLNHLWSLNKRIIWAYNEKKIVQERSGDVWWPVTQKWPNKRSLEELNGYFRDLFKSGGVNNGGVVWSAMSELTPNTWDVISDKLKGLRHMADSTNKHVTAWFRGDWGSIVNGVSVDFLRSTGIVDAAIRWNRRRAQGKKCD